MAMRKCEVCGVVIKKANKGRRFCNQRCRWQVDKHRPEVQAKRRAYYQENREKVLAKSKEWAANNVARRRKNYRKYQTSLYGITEDDYQERLKEQDRKCAICQLKKKPLVIDHCHSSQKVRGLLCRSCNQSLGLIQDSPSLLRAAISYLERNG